MDTIGNRILLAVGVAGLLPLILVAVVNRTIISTELRNSEFEKYNEISLELAREVTSTMRSISEDLDSLSSNPRIAGASVSLEEKVHEMERLVNIYKFTDISLFDENGVMLGTTAKYVPDPVDMTRWRVRVASGDSAKEVSPPERLMDSEELCVSIYLPVEGALKRTGQVLKARVPFKDVWTILDEVKIGDRGVVVLLDSFGNILSHRDKNLILTKFDDRYPFDFWERSPSGTYESKAGDKFSYVAKVLPKSSTRNGLPWVQLALIPSKELVAATYAGNRFLLVAGFAAFVVLIGLGRWMSQKISISIVNAASVAHEVAKGSMAKRIPEKGPLEIRRLATTFNEMVDEVDGHRKKLLEELKVGGEKLKDSEKELDVASAQIRAAFESTREAVLIIRNDGVVIAANDRLRTFFNLPVNDLVLENFVAFEKKFFACFEEPSLMKAHWNDLQRNERESRDAEWTVVSPKPLSITSYAAPVRDGNGEIIARLWMFEDLTKQRELQKGLEQAQKMEAIGRLAGGVAHDFNNLLTGIIGNLSLAQMNGGDAMEKSGGAPFIKTARTAAERAATLVKQLLGFSRRNHLALQACNVNDMLTEVCDLIVHTFDPRVELVTKKSPDLWGVEVDPSQVQQVVMNLCVNARDAMPEGGVLVLSTENVEVGISEAARHDSVPGEYVKLTVSDSGQGVPKELLDKIFEPFFTTKEPGKGTGLGLATSYGIVQQHGGWIECRSEEGSGATFSILLPKGNVETSGREVLPSGRAEVADSVSTSDETILLIDDERVVRTVAESVLAHAGFETLSASDGIEGIEMVRSHGDKIALVLLDLTMPKMSGSDTLRVIREVRPDLPVVICSGYLLDLDNFAHEVGIRPEGLIQKPYKVAELPLMVRKVIDRCASGEDKTDIPGRGEAVGGDEGIALRS